MPYKEKNIDKLYYSIGEVAEMFDVRTSLIRFWEKEFTVLKPKKNKKGNRLFTPKDIENIKRIYQLVKEDGFTLEGAKQQLKGKSSTESTPVKPATDNSALIERLEQIKLDLLKIEREL
ncbi:MAG: MerR family transcriptional regulator [Flavobacteriales bacterium]|nr:MerR family transcriptional regulator [Flavobacteriales bacterium]